MKLTNLTKLSCSSALVSMMLSAPQAVHAADYPTTVSNLNPVAYYRLNDPAVSTQFADAASNSTSLGGAANGYYLGTAGSTYTHPVTTGLVGGMTGATSFAGGWAAMPYFSNFNGSTFAAEMWFNVIAGDTGVLCESCNLDGRYGWILYYGEDGTEIVSARYYDGGGSSFLFKIVTSNTVPDSTWHHVVTQSDGTTASLYVDGVFCGSNPLNPGGTSYVPATIAHATPFTVFGRIDNGFISQGMAAQVAIYTNVLSAAQILNHYNTGLAANPSPSYGALVVSDGALAYWPLNDPAFTPPDSSTYPVAVNSGTMGTAANGTYLPGAMTGAAGPGFPGITDGGACHFDGLTSAFNGATNLPGYIDIEGMDSANITTSITLMAWVQRDAWVNDYASVTGKGDNSWRIARYGGDSTIQFGLNDSTGFFGIVQSKGAINDSGWHHLVGVYDGTNNYFYIDGVLDTMQPDSGDTINNNADLASIGEDTGAKGRVWAGNLAEVAIFTTALTAAQVTAVYDSAKAPPSIVVQPQITPPVYAGSTVSLDVEALGATPLTYQWTSNTVIISGQTQTNLTLVSVTPAYDADYAVVVSNAYGSVTSTPVTLSIQNTKPVIFQQPASLSLAAGGNATFTVDGGGTTPISYQWFLDGTAISGATDSTLAISPIQTSEFGTYTVLLSNSLGTSNSLPAVLTQVIPPNAYAATVMALNPFTYYLLNSTNGKVAPDIASGLNGTVNGNMTIGAGATGPGFAGTHDAFQFDGTTNGGTAFVDCGNFNLDQRSQTIIAWVNQSSVIDQKAIVCKQNGSWRVQTFSGGYFEDSDTGTTPGNDGWEYFLTGTVGDATWHMLACTLDNGVKNVYEDGVLLIPYYAYAAQEFSADISGLVDTNSQPVYIGENTGLGNGYWNGLISDVALFNRGLSAAEVSDLWEVATNGVSAPVIGIPPASRTVTLGQKVTFVVRISSGSAPFTYQWNKNGVPIAGAIGTSITFDSTGYGDSGSYDVVVNNSVGPAATSTAAILSVVPPATYANLTNGLVLHLPFDGNYNDTSGQGNNANPSSPPPIFVPGKIGSQAVQVSSIGTFTYVNVPYSPEFAFGPPVSFFGGNAGTDYSVSLWVKYTGLPNDLPMIGNSVNSTYQAGWVMTDDLGKPEWSLYATDEAGARTGDPVPGAPITDDGVWHNIVLTISWIENRIDTYVDGKQVFHTPTGIIDSLDTGNPIVLGNDPTGTYNVPGTYILDDVGIWNLALTEVQAESIYYAGQNGHSFDVSGPGSLAIARDGSGLVITWSAGTLQSAPALTGPWTPVTGASPPSYFVTPSGTGLFYRVKQ